MSKIIKLDQGPVVMGHFKVVVLLFGLFFTMVAFMSKPIFGWTLLVLFTPVCVVLLGARFVVEIDLEARTLSDLTDVVFHRWGSRTSIEHAEKIFINKIRMSRRIIRYGTGSPLELKSYDYKAFLKLTSGEKLPLLTREDLSEVRAELDELASELKIPITQNFEDS